MASPKFPAIRQVLILKSDRMMAETILRGAREAWPRARFRIVQRVKAALAALRVMPVDILLTGFGMPDGDVCTLVQASARPPRAARGIVIVSGRRDPRFLALLHELPIDGAFDTATEALNQLPAVLRRIRRGGRYFSRSFLTLLRKQDTSASNIFRLLTDAELLTLAILGDGCRCKEAAVRLKLSVQTIRSLRRDLRRKLGGHQNGDLAQVAQKNGLVRFTGNRIERPGLELLARRYAKSRRKRQNVKFVTDLCRRCA